MDLRRLGLDQVGDLFWESWPKDLVLPVFSEEKPRLLLRIIQVIRIQVPVDLRAKLGDEVLDQLLLRAGEGVEAHKNYLLFWGRNLIQRLGDFAVELSGIG